MSFPFLSKRYINVFTALLIVLVFYFLYSETQPAASPPSSHFTRPEVAVPANFGPPEPVKNIGEQALDHTLALEQKIFCRVLPEFTSASYSTRDVLLHGRTFKMAYFTNNDIVSSSIKSSGTWEGPLVESILEKLALVSKIRGEDKATFIDIGANIGWFSMAIGSQGYKVIAFEPMPQNEALFRSSLCFNPEINARVRYHALGLGKTTEFCDLWSDNYNLGDGHVSCGNAPIKGVTDSNSYSRRATINVQKLDDVMGTTHLDDIAVIKLDVEGFEPNVFNGALTWLERAQPPFLVSEIAPSLMAPKGLSPLELLQTIDSLGYDIRKESWEGMLITPSQFSTHIAHVGNEEIYMTSRKWKTA